MNASAIGIVVTAVVLLLTGVVLLRAAFDEALVIVRFDAPTDIRVLDAADDER